MGNRYEFIAPCHFGLEAVCKREIADLGYEIVKVEDGKVTFAGDMEALVRANIFLRTTQRILLKVAEFKAVTFEELFQNVKKVPWEEYFPSDARFWVTKATSVKSKLFSPSDIQSIVKKAMVERDDMSVTELAKEIGYSRAHVSQVINGTMVPSANIKSAIESCLNLRA